MCDNPTKENRVSGICGGQMTLSLPPEKIAKLQKECRHASNQGRQTTRQLAHLIGMMTSCIPAVLPAPLHYRALQRLRLEALGPSRVDYDHAIPLSAQALQDLEWWITQLPLNASQPILPVPPVMSLETDASMIPYSGKFSRGPIFAVFAVDWQTTKIKPAK